MLNHNDLHKILYDYNQLIGYSSAFDQRRAFAAEHFENVLYAALEGTEERPIEKQRSIADNYPAGGIGKCEDCPALDDAIADSQYDMLKEFDAGAADSTDLYTWIKCMVAKLKKLQEVK